MSPAEADKATIQAFKAAYGMCKNPNLIKAAGYRDLEHFITAERDRIEKALQKWEKTNG